jgi:predicted ABC-type ATPase
MEYVCAGSVEECVRRVRIRAHGCGHAASEARIRTIYQASLEKLPSALAELDEVAVHDNSRRGTPANPPRLTLVLRATGGRVSWVAPDPTEWLRKALEGTPFTLSR